MTATPGVNSYVTEAEADTYFLERFGYSDWAALDSTSKNQALVSAYNELEYMCEWYGYKTASDQVQQFPRNGDTVVPDEIKAAQCEIAYSMVSADSSNVEDADVLTSLTAGSVSLEFKGDVSPSGGYSNHLKNLLKSFGACSYSGGTSIVNVGRA